MNNYPMFFSKKVMAAFGGFCMLVGQSLIATTEHDAREMLKTATLLAMQKAPKIADITIPAEQFGNYASWPSAQQLFARGQGVLRFKARMSNDLHLAFSSSQNMRVPMYEIVLGGYSNSKSVIRRKSQGQNKQESYFSLDPVTEFMVTIDKNAKLIRVQKVETNGALVTAIEWTDPRFLNDILYFSFSGWDASGKVTDIVVHQ